MEAAAGSLARRMQPQPPQGDEDAAASVAPPGAPRPRAQVVATLCGLRQVEFDRRRRCVPRQMDSEQISRSRSERPAAAAAATRSVPLLRAMKPACMAAML